MAVEQGGEASPRASTAAQNRHRSLKRVSKAILDTTSIKQEPPELLYRAGVSIGSSIQTPHSILETIPPSSQGLADDGKLLRSVSMSVIDLQMTSSVEPIHQWDYCCVLSCFRSSVLADQVNNRHSRPSGHYDRVLSQVATFTVSPRFIA